MRPTILLTLLTGILLPAGALAGTVTLCAKVEADLKPVGATDKFAAGAKEVFAVFTLDTGENFNKMTSTWVAVDVGDAAPANYRIASADLDLKGQKKGKLSYTQPNPMPEGKYRLEIQMDGKPWKTVEFTVGAPPATKPAG
jgi:hypothetical protein